ncbi:ABC transporter substrate-binding protein [Lysobacter korlensis]|uniref:ABC transporter substrate-binding protein n=1 Tax=Lysobacter korlensis TaxID=553636 RepID=A0ABV6RYY0_9GAMM
MAVHKGVRRSLRAGAVAMAGVLALAACAGGGGEGPGAGPSEVTDPAEPITITYAGAAYAADQIQPVLDAFESEHPNIKVEYESVPFDDFNSVLAARLTNASDAIDVFDVDMPRTDAYVARGWLADLTATFPDLADSVDPGSLEAATVDGKLVTMPYQTSTNIMYYNKDLLEAAGVDFPSADPADRLTWEVVEEQATAAQEAGATYGIVFDQIDRYYQLEPLAISAGGGPGATGEMNLDPDVANDGWVKAFDWYGGLFEKGLSPRGVAVAETPEIFAGGQTAFYVGGPWWAGMFVADPELDFGVAPFPAFEGGEPSTPTGGWSLGLNPKADEERANAAAVFMKFMGLDDGGYAQYLSALAVPPSNLEGGVKFYESEAFADPRMAGVVDLMKFELENTSTLRLQTVGYVEFEDVMTRTFSDIINGADAGEALATAESELDEAWESFR